jgi:hypothetical protein
MNFKIVKIIMSSRGEFSKKLEALEAQLGDFSEFERDPITTPIYFLADISHPETIALKERYAKDRQKIEALVKGPKFMDRVFQRLLGSNGS